MSLCYRSLSNVLRTPADAYWPVPDDMSDVLAKQTGAMDKILIPWPPDGTHTTIDFASLLRFYDTQSDNYTLGMYHLQTSLTRLATNACYFAFRHFSSPLITGLPPSLRIGYEAHMTSLANPGAGRWLSVVPSEPRFALTNTDYVCAIRTRLYLQGHTLPLTHCNCQPFEDAVGAYVDDPLHALSCMRSCNRQITHRHHLVVGIVANAIRQCGTPVEVEASGLIAIIWSSVSWPMQFDNVEYQSRSKRLVSITRRTADRTYLRRSITSRHSLTLESCIHRRSHIDESSVCRNGCERDRRACSEPAAIAVT